MEFKKILILGNTGFIGGRLQRYLINHFSDTEVIGYSTREVDLTDERDARKLIKDFDLNTAVVMCSMVKKEFGDNLESYTKNLAMAVNVCRVLEKAAVKRFVYLSSTAVYGEDIENTNITEQTNVQPTSFYGMAKYTSENLFRKVFSSMNKSILLVLRPPLIYGAGDRSQAYGPAMFIKKALANEKIVLWGDGEEIREFVFIDDLVSIISQFVVGGYSGVVNIVSGTKYSFQDALDVIETKLKTPLRIETKERTKNKADHCFNNGLLRKLLPDFAFTPLDQGIQKTMELELSLAK